MAQQTSSSRVKLIILLLALGLGMYIVGPPLYWQFHEGVTAARDAAECPVCTCDCSTSNLVNAAISSFGNLSLGDCGKDDPDMREEAVKSRSELLAEELKLQEQVAEDNRQRAEMTLLDAKKLSSQYQKEAEKCNIGMETSEGARERAEAALGVARKAAALWEKRARGLGWKFTDNEEDVSNEDSTDLTRRLRKKF